MKSVKEATLVSMIQAGSVEMNPNKMEENMIR